jgi:lipopolysaccharide export system protein LptC
MDRDVCCDPQMTLGFDGANAADWEIKAAHAAMHREVFMVLFVDSLVNPEGSKRD